MTDAAGAWEERLRAVPKRHMFGCDGTCSGAMVCVMEVDYAAMAALVETALGEPCHASASDGHKCSDCRIDSEPCPDCYESWWMKRHPNVIRLRWGHSGNQRDMPDEQRITALEAALRKLEAERDTESHFLTCDFHRSNKFFYSCVDCVNRAIATSRTNRAALREREGESARLRYALERFKHWADKWSDSAGPAATFKATDQYREMTAALAAPASREDGGGMKVRGPDGNLHEATRISVETTQEGWNEYLCSDGAVIRLKVVLTSVLRLDGLYTADGVSVYNVQSSNVLSVDPPDSLRKPEGTS